MNEPIDGKKAVAQFAAPIRGSDSTSYPPIRGPQFAAANWGCLSVYDIKRMLIELVAPFTGTTSRGADDDISDIAGDNDFMLSPVAHNIVNRSF